MLNICNYKRVKINWLLLTKIFECSNSLSMDSPNGSHPLQWLEGLVHSPLEYLLKWIIILQSFHDTLIYRYCISWIIYFSSKNLCSSYLILTIYCSSFKSDIILWYCSSMATIKYAAFKKSMQCVQCVCMYVCNLYSINLLALAFYFHIIIHSAKLLEDEGT